VKKGKKGLAGPCCYGVSGTLVAIAYTATSRDDVRRALEKVGCRVETQGDGDGFRLIVTNQVCGGAPLVSLSGPARRQGDE
jgi:hypothetical protein